MKIFKHRNANQKTAFSLIELSVVLVVLSLLATGFLSTIVSNSSNQKTNSTHHSLNKIYNSLNTYLAVNKRLPCPASLKVELSSSSYGLEDSSNGSCISEIGVYSIDNSLAYGMVPVATLGLQKDDSQDAYGNKIIYIVIKNFTDAAPNLFSLVGNITISKYLSGTAYSDETDAIFLLISHGANSNGAFPYGLITQNSVGTADSSELQNIITSLDDTNKTAVISNASNFTKYSNASTTFDDILLYKNKDILFNDAGSIPLGTSDFFTKVTQ